MILVPLVYRILPASGQTDRGDLRGHGGHRAARADRPRHRLRRGQPRGREGGVRVRARRACSSCRASSVPPSAGTTCRCRSSTAPMRRSGTPRSATRSPASSASWPSAPLILGLARVLGTAVRRPRAGRAVPREQRGDLDDRLPAPVGAMARVGWLEQTVGGITASIEHAVFTEQHARQRGVPPGARPARQARHVPRAHPGGEPHRVADRPGGRSTPCRWSPRAPATCRSTTSSSASGSASRFFAGVVVVPALFLVPGPAAVRPAARAAPPRAVGPGHRRCGHPRRARRRERLAGGAARPDDPVGRHPQEPARAARAAGLRPRPVHDLPLHLPVPAHGQRHPPRAQEPDRGADERRRAAALDQRDDGQPRRPRLQDEQRRLRGDDGPGLHGRGACLQRVPHARRPTGRPSRRVARGWR